jgi:hypothetical protein
MADWCRSGGGGGARREGGSIDGGGWQTWQCSYLLCHRTCTNGRVILKASGQAYIVQWSMHLVHD